MDSHQEGVEIVLEVDGIDAERVQVVKTGWELNIDNRSQLWGWRNFMNTDPDFYDLRVTTRGPNGDSWGPP